MREENFAKEGELTERGVTQRKLGTRQMNIHDVLQGIWADVAKPILKMLGYAVSGV
jgi:hypothetical protein